jgi:uncharacterized protein YeaO (DUF488 family)
VYEPASPDDGERVLIDRLWPRGVSKAELTGVRWMKEVAPSTDLRRWFGHDPERWPEFRARYDAELKGNQAFDELAGLARKHPVTLLYGARDAVHNDAVVLAELLNRRAA